MLLNEARANEALSYWHDCHQPVSSELTLFECSSVIHRYADKMPQTVGATWSKESFNWLDTISQRLILHAVEGTVLTFCRSRKAFGACRTLDAIHLATACLFQKAAEEFLLITFDRRMQTCARDLGVPVIDF